MTSWGYARVSTADQNTVDQCRRLKDAGIDRVFTDVASGSHSSRPGLSELMDVAAEGDSVTVCRLDRLGRDMLHTLSLIEELKSRGVSFRSLDDGIDANSPTGQLMIGLMASLAQYERELIRERTTAGLRTARALGRVGGRPPALNAENMERLRAMDRAGLKADEIARAMGVSRSTAYNYLKAMRAQAEVENPA